LNEKKAGEAIPPLPGGTKSSLKVTWTRRMGLVTNQCLPAHQLKVDSQLDLQKQASRPNIIHTTSTLSLPPSLSLISYLYFDILGNPFFSLLSLSLRPYARPRHADTFPIGRCGHSIYPPLPISYGRCRHRLQPCPCRQDRFQPQ